MNSTFSGNSATNTGGAIFSVSGDQTQLLLTASTISGNSAAAGLGGGISGEATLTDTIVALDSGGELLGSMLGDHNLIGDASGGLDPSNNLLNVATRAWEPCKTTEGRPRPSRCGPAAPPSARGRPGVVFDQRFAGRPTEGPFDIGSFQTGSDSPSLVVNTTADVVNPTDGVTSLREAIAYANAKLGPDEITFDPKVFAVPQTITLDPALGQLSIQDDLTIIGPAAGVTIARTSIPTRRSSASSTFPLRPC